MSNITTEKRDATAAAQRSMLERFTKRPRGNDPPSSSQDTLLDITPKALLDYSRSLFSAACTSGVFPKNHTTTTPLPWSDAVVHIARDAGRPLGHAAKVASALRETLTKNPDVVPWVTRATRVPQFSTNSAIVIPPPGGKPVVQIPCKEVINLLKHVIPSTAIPTTASPLPPPTKPEWGAATLAVMPTPPEGVPLPECAKSALLAAVLAVAFSAQPEPMVFNVHPSTAAWLFPAIGAHDVGAGRAPEIDAARDSLAAAVFSSTELQGKVNDVTKALGVSLFITSSSSNVDVTHVVVPEIAKPPNAPQALRAFALGAINEAKLVGVLDGAEEERKSVAYCVNVCLAACDLPPLSMCVVEQ